MTWFQRLFGRRDASYAAPTERAGNGVLGLGDTSRVPNAPPTERVGDFLRRGGNVRPLAPHDLTDRFRASLRNACEADLNVRSVWLAWMTAADGRDELLTILALDHTDEAAVRRFVARVDALNGPRCTAALAGAGPTVPPFYSRGKAS